MDIDFYDAKVYLEHWVDARGIARSDVLRVFEGLEMCACGDSGTLHSGQTPTVVFPGLSASPWWNPKIFPWFESLRADAEGIFSEYCFASNGQTGSLEAARRNIFQKAGAWRTIQLVNRGVLQRAAGTMPRTVSALADVPGALACGMTFFSVLGAKSAISPHSGFTNAHLRGHLVLKPVEGALLRVGDEWRAWNRGELLVFDDTYEHEAVNEGGDDRVVLLFDLWHPEVSDVERVVFGECLAHLRRAAARAHIVNVF